MNVCHAENSEGTYSIVSNKVKVGYAVVACAENESNGGAGRKFRLNVKQVRKCTEI